MTHLLDTNTWLRAVTEPTTLPEAIRRILDERDAVFGLSAISLWEVGKKHQIGKLELKKELRSWLNEAIANHINVLPLTPEIVAEAMTLPDFPNRDPADEIIVATARVHKMSLLTADTKLKNYRHARIRYFTPTFIT